MNTWIKRDISEELARLIFHEEGLAADKGVTWRKEGEWKDDSKYQYLSIIFQQEGFNGFWQLDIQRSGSYFSDYYYEYPSEVVQVEEKEVTTTIWVAVTCKV